MHNLETQHLIRYRALNWPNSIFDAQKKEKEITESLVIAWNEA